MKKGATCTPEGIAKMRATKRSQNLAREKSTRWNGGVKNVRGYRYSLVQSKNVQTGATNIYRGDHRLIAERALGRPLKRNEVVHHINGDQADNRNKNLLISSRAYHNWLEGKIAFLYKREHFA